MKNPFPKILTALKVGYRVLQKYEQLEDAGLVPTLKIKNVPVTEIDKAAKSFVLSLRDQQKEKRSE